MSVAPPFAETARPTKGSASALLLPPPRSVPDAPAGGSRTERLRLERTIVVIDEAAIPPPKPEFLQHVQAFRGVAILLIVAAHCISVFDWTAAPWLERSLAVLLKNSSVCFVFVTGFLVRHLAPRLRIVDYWRSRFEQVVLPYLCMSVPALIVCGFLLERHGLSPEFRALPVWQRIVGFLLNGDHLAPFWYIPFTVMLFLLTPLLLRLEEAASRRLRMPVWPLLLVVSWLIPRSHWACVNVIHFLPVYLAGMACCRDRHALRAFLGRFEVFAWTLCLGLFLWETLGPHRLGFVNLLQKILLTILLLHRLEHSSLARSPWLNRLAEISFGMYFVHGYVIAGGKLLLPQLAPAGLPGTPLLFLAVLLSVTALSCLLLTLGRRLLGQASRRVIGC